MTVRKTPVDAASAVVATPAHPGKSFRLKAPQTPESALLRQIVDYLRMMQVRGRVVWFARLNGGSVVAGAGPARRFVRFYHLYLRGREPLGQGMADLCGMLPDGRYFALEVKRPGEKPSEAQRNFLESVRAAGGIGVVVRGFEDVASVLFGEINPHRNQEAYP